MTSKAAKLPKLEASLEEITGLVDKMEHGELTLEESLANFERGITLIKHCQKILTEAEHKVQVLAQKNGQEMLLSENIKGGSPNADDEINE